MHDDINYIYEGVMDAEYKETTDKINSLIEDLKVLRKNIEDAQI